MIMIQTSRQECSTPSPYFMAAGPHSDLSACSCVQQALSSTNVGHCICHAKQSAMIMIAMRSTAYAPRCNNGSYTAECTAASS